MVRDWVDSHLYQYVLLMLVLGILFGIVATYLISFILAINKITEILFMTWSGGTSG